MKPLRIDFVISNDRHHVATFEPIIRQLQLSLGVECMCRIVSLCELRGIETPMYGLPVEGESIISLFPRNIRRSPATGRQSGSSVQKVARKFARRLCCHLILRRQVERWLETRPGVVVVPNDAAFPYDFICAMLRSRGIPFVLVQEGVRFPLPTEKDGAVYGGNGAAHVAAWGEASAEYFRQSGVPLDRLRLTGCPRFDCIAETDWTEAVSGLRERLGLWEKTVLFLTNPVDDLGFCTTADKLDLVVSLVRTVIPVLEDEDSSLVLKLHAREAPEDYEPLLQGLPGRDRVNVVGNVPLYPLLASSTAAITMASTAGLEALLFGLPLSVMKLPKFGYVHDYVSSDAAWGMEPGGAAAEALRQMLQSPERRGPAVDAYLDRQLARRTGATEQVVGVILEAAA